MHPQHRVIAFCLTYKSKLSYTHTSERNFLSIQLAFEVPIFIIVICWAGITAPESLNQKRPCTIVGAFVFDMLLTPLGGVFPNPVGRANVVVI
jgi:Sec-independent protein secretion pathway component TatC